MVYQVESSKPLSQVARDLEVISPQHKFGILGVHDLKAKLNEKGVEFDRECRVYEVCNPQQAKRVLDANLEIATALPCRIALYSTGKGTILSTIKPTALIEMYQTPGLKSVAEEVEAALIQIMDEASH